MTDLKDYREHISAELSELFDATDRAIEEAWTGEGNVQLPPLIVSMAVKCNWDEKTMRENDPIIRKYLRKHPVWYVTRGAHGGIMKREDFEKKNASKIAKDLAKQEMRAALEAKALEAKLSAPTTDE